MAHRLAGARLGATTDEDQALDDERVPVVEGDPPPGTDRVPAGAASGRERTTVRPGRRRVAARAGRRRLPRAGCWRWTGCWAGSWTGCWGCWLRAREAGRLGGGVRRRAAAVGAATSLGAGRVRGGGARKTGGSTAGAGMSRMAVRLTTCLGPRRPLGLDLLGTGRTSTTTEEARWSCQPRRWRLAVLDGGPRQRGQADAEGRARTLRPGRGTGTRAGPTPIGVPVPWWTTRSPIADLPGVLPETPIVTARTSQQQRPRPRRRSATTPQLVAERPARRRTPTTTYRLQPTSRSTAKA